MKIYLLTMRALLLSCLLFLSLLAAAQPYQIGHRTITFADASRTGGFGSGGGAGRQIQCEIYYPAASTADNVAIVGSNYPVVVFGHGFVMTWDAYQNIWEDLVPLGYIVVFPRTEGGLPPSHGDFGLDIAYVAQAMQTRGATDPTFFFYQKTAPTTALMGHSMGGGAALLGAANNTNITCTVTFAAAETNPSAVSAAANIKVPTLIVAGANDCVAPPSTNQTLMYNACGSKCKAMVTLTGASHCQFGESNFNCNFGEATCSPSPTISRSQQHTNQALYYITFLNKYLKGICSANSNFDGALQTGTGLTSFQQTCAAQAGADVTICPNAPVSLGTTNMAGYTFNWVSNPAGFTSTAQTLTVNPTNSTTYILTYTNLQSNCSVIDSVVVNIPVSGASAGVDALICPGDSRLLGTPTLPNLTYSWTSIPAGFTANTAQVTVQPNVSTAYYLTIGDGTCTKLDTATVTISAIPTAVITVTGATTFCEGNSVTLTATSGFANYNWLVDGETTQSISATHSGNYQVVGSNNTQCLDTSDVVVVTVKPSPHPVITIDGPTPICPGTNRILSVELGHAAYLWGPVLNNTPQLTINAANDYIVVVSDTNGCTGSDTISITEFTQPTVSINLVNDTLFATGNSSGGLYWWSFNAIELMSPYFVPLSNGVYNVEFTDTNGCIATASYTVNKVGLTELSQQGIKLYPNPATHSVYIENSGNEPLTVTLYNAIGQIVGSIAKSNQKLLEVAINHFNTGIYWVKIESKQGIYYQKIVKQ